MTILKSMLLLVCLTGSASAMAQCETEQQINASLLQLRQDSDALNSRIKTGMQSNLKMLDDKAKALGWSEQQKQEFKKNKIENNGQFVFLTLQIQQQQFEIRNIQDELRSEAVRKDPKLTCTTGLKMVPVTKKMSDLLDEQISFIKERIEEIQ